MATQKIITKNNYTISISDVGKHLLINSAFPITIIVSSTGIPSDSEIMISNYGTGLVNFISDNTAIIRSSNNELSISNQYDSVCLIKLSILPENKVVWVSI